MLCGCQSPQPEREPAAPADPAGPILSEADQRRVDDLLSRADAALAADHLSYPAKDSALNLLDAVLAIDPTSAPARRGLERIVERYVDLAERAAARGQVARARSMLDRARIVDPDHPAIGPTTARLQFLETAERELLRMDPAALRSRAPDLIGSLQRIGTQARKPGCRTTIRVGSDADGRWIYKHMSGGPEQRRIRAQVQIGSPPQVEVLCQSG